MPVWIQVPEDGVVTVWNGLSQPVCIIVRADLHPTVQCGTNHFYPVAWKGFIHARGVSEHWEYASGPIREVRLRTENGDTKWLLAVWK